MYVGDNGFKQKQLHMMSEYLQFKMISIRLASFLSKLWLSLQHRLSEMSECGRLLPQTRQRLDPERETETVVEFELSS